MTYIENVGERTVRHDACTFAGDDDGPLDDVPTDADLLGGEIMKRILITQEDFSYLQQNVENELALAVGGGTIVVGNMVKGTALGGIKQSKNKEYFAGDAVILEPSMF